MGNLIRQRSSSRISIQQDESVLVNGVQVLTDGERILNVLCGNLARFE